MTYEEMRFTHQCPERLAQRLFGDLEESRAEVAHLQSALAAANAMHTMEQALRARAENKVAGLAPRRTNRDRKEG